MEWRPKLIKIIWHTASAALTLKIEYEGHFSKKTLLALIPVLALVGCGGGDTVTQDQVKRVKMGPTVTTGGEIIRAIAPASGRGLAITQKPNERAIAHYDDQEAIVPDS